MAKQAIDCIFFDQPDYEDYLLSIWSQNPEFTHHHIGHHPPALASAWPSVPGIMAPGVGIGIIVSGSICRTIYPSMEAPFSTHPFLPHVLSSPVSPLLSSRMPPLLSNPVPLLLFCPSSILLSHSAPVHLLSHPLQSSSCSVLLQSSSCPFPLQSSYPAPLHYC